MKKSIDTANQGKNSIQNVSRENNAQGNEQSLSHNDQNKTQDTSSVGFDFSKTSILSETPPNDSLPRDLQVNMENAFGADFSNVKIHKNSRQATELNALAFTQGEKIHFAPGEFNPNSHSGRNLIGHEITHVMQQRNGIVNPTAVLGKGISLNNDQGLENEADSFGRKATKGININKYHSASLGIRNSIRSSVQAKSNVIQRDIKGSQNLKRGKMELNFTKNDATAKGVSASEEGTVKFTPNNIAPNSDSIGLIQIVKTVDVGGTTTKAGKTVDWTKVGTGAEADRNKVTTANNSKKNIAGGFFIDHLAAKASPRTKKSDSTVSPFYRDYAPNKKVSQDGYKKSKTKIQYASLWDGPGSSIPLKYNFVTSVKAADTGAWYGTALWGFEIYSDKGILKIKNEYNSFREVRGETFDAALKKFDEFYKNPGTPGAPKK